MPAITETKLFKLFDGTGASVRDIVAALHEAAHVIVFRDLGELDSRVGQKKHENGVGEHWTKPLTENIPTWVLAHSLTAALIMTEAIEEVVVVEGRLAVQVADADTLVEDRRAGTEPALRVDLQGPRRDAQRGGWQEDRVAILVLIEECFAFDHDLGDASLG